MYSSDNDLKIRITNDKDVTPEFIVNEASVIWGKVKAKKVNTSSQTEVDACMSEMREQHKEFCMSYPIVLRYMVQMGEYHTKAFKSYLDHIKYHPWKSEAEYLDSQADYVVRLYKARNKKWNTTHVNNLRANIRNMLEAEHKGFKETVEKYKDQVDAEEKILNALKLSELKQWYDLNKDDIDDLHLRAKVEDALINPPVDITSFVSEVENKMTKVLSKSEAVFGLT